jgi:hypothetical protein
MVGIPEGYTLHDGSGLPSDVEPEQFVDLIIRTGEGLAHSGVVRARTHFWDQDAPDTFGHIVAYRLAQLGEDIDVDERWPEA